MSAVDTLLAAARQRLSRIGPNELNDAIKSGALVVDIRPEHYRLDEGAIPGALIIERNVLEWRLDPTSDSAIPEADMNRLVILVCNEGYASSFAALSLRQLGLNATDLEGGFRSWQRREQTHARRDRVSIQ